MIIKFKLDRSSSSFLSFSSIFFAGTTIGPGSSQQGVYPSIFFFFSPSSEGFFGPLSLGDTVSLSFSCPCSFDSIEQGATAGAWLFFLPERLNLRLKLYQRPCLIGAAGFSFAGVSSIESWSLGIAFSSSSSSGSFRRFCGFFDSSCIMQSDAIDISTGI